MSFTHISLIISHILLLRCVVKKLKSQGVIKLNRCCLKKWVLLCGTHFSCKHTPFLLHHESRAVCGLAGLNRPTPHPQTSQRLYSWLCSNTIAKNLCVCFIEKFAKLFEYKNLLLTCKIPILVKEFLFLHLYLCRTKKL